MAERETLVAEREALVARLVVAIGPVRGFAPYFDARFGCIPGTDRIETEAIFTVIHDSRHVTVRRRCGTRRSSTRRRR